MLEGKDLSIVIVEKFAEDVKRALDNAASSGYDQVDEDSGAVAEDIVTLDADLEGFPPALLIPHIEHWQMIKRIEQNKQKEN
jgi:hypothetical protein